MFTLCGRRFCRVFGVKMMDQSFIFSTALAVGCGVGIGWIVRGILRSRSETNDLASEIKVGTMGEGDACKLVIVVRTDLQMGKGKIAAQCCHAAVMAYEQLYEQHPDLLEEWRYHGQPKVILKTEDEESLLRLPSHAHSLGLVVSIVRDAGRTQIAAGSKTTVGIGPGPKDKIDTVTGHLKLM